MLPSGRARTMDNRVGWALTYLRQAGLAESPSRGRVIITRAGREALVAYPDRIDMKTLEAYPSYLEFKERSRTKDASVTVTTTDETAIATPQELIEQALATNRAAVTGDVLRNALALSPEGFEALVLRLLAAMGYGQLGTVEATSISGDAGVDGIISQDHSGWTASTSRPSGMRRTTRSPARGSMSLPGHCSASRVTVGCSSRPPASRQAPGRRPSASTPGSSSSTGSGWPGC